ncbi:MAG: hypothetical protein FJ104_11725, partial [Deltaproteobacteria bacterium]|nr:hypothetical protein [Deltaproteobacteria bacterium]
MRLGLWVLGAALGAAAPSMAGCCDTDPRPPPQPQRIGTGGADPGTLDAAASGGASPVAPGSCEGACCPTEKSCYSDPAVGNGSPGSECLARRDNTGTKRIQMRQTWIRPTAPKGNTIPLVYGALNTYSQLREPGCFSPNGTSGYIQLNDFDLENGISRVGYAKFLPEASVAAGPTDGLCMVAEDAFTMKAPVGGSERDFSIPADDLPSATDLGWLAGMPAPMAQPWRVAPTKA